MAVRQGYGKIVTDGLVFAYDTGDVINSYKGEPTENLFGAPEDYVSNLFLAGIASVEPNAGYAPDGTYTATKLTFYTGANLVSSFAKNISLSGATAGRRFTVSFWEKNLDIDQTAQDFTPTIEPYVVSPGTGSTQATTIEGVNYGNRTLSTDWRYSKLTFEIPQNDATNLYTRIYRDTSTNAGTGSLLIWNAQYEEKPHPTPYTPGTRSATSTLVDLAGSTSFDISNVSFDSNAQIVFDGTDDEITHDNVQFLSSSSWTMSQIQKIDENANENWQAFSGNTRYLGTTTDNGGYFMWHSLGRFWWYQSFDDPTYYGAISQTLSGGDIFARMKGNGYFSVDITYNGNSNTMKVYINGVLELTTTPTWRVGLDRITFASAGGAHDRRFTGEIPLQRLYSKELTASEVLQNFNHYKGRFNL